ncbi:ParB-like nuclease [Escherichia coli]|uniref:ParB-like nuclease n=1 Tax=Escherichia coli TaxID=562 RepID=A0A2X3JND1_ECOLX|nr:ParB-like nuclease [Escherichia coli]
MGDTMQQRLTQDLTQFLASLPEDDRIKAINEIRMAIHQVSPFREEPVDCVLWVKNSQLMPNDYNPNNVAPPEKKLLKKSIEIDGFTNPLWSRIRIKMPWKSWMVFTAMKLVKAHHH